MGEILDYFKKKKNLANLLLLGILILGLPMGVSLVRQQQIIIQSRATAEPIRFTGEGVTYNDTNKIWTATSTQVSLVLTSPLGPAAAGSSSQTVKSKDSSPMVLWPQSLVETAYAADTWYGCSAWTQDCKECGADSNHPNELWCDFECTACGKVNEGACGDEKQCGLVSDPSSAPNESCIWGGWQKCGNSPITYCPTDVCASCLLNQADTKKDGRFLDIYRDQGGWEAEKCDVQTDIMHNWCSVANPTQCNELKNGVCAGQCGVWGCSGDPCSDCIIQKGPNDPYVDPDSSSLLVFYKKNNPEVDGHPRWDTNCGTGQIEIVNDWCTNLNPGHCESIKNNECDLSCNRVVPASVTTDSYRLAEDPNNFNSTLPWLPYADGMTVPHDFRSSGQKSIFVQFKDSNENTGGCGGADKAQPCQANITILGAVASSATSQLSLGAKVFCRAPSNHDTDNVDLILAGNFVEGKKISQEVTIDKDGVVKKLAQKLQEGKEYTVSLKAPMSLRRNIKFIAGSDFTNISGFVLPVGDIFPVDGGDGIINSLDKAELNRQWIISRDAGNRSGDFNQDGRVNSVDWACMRYDFGKSNDDEPTVPLPASSTDSSSSASGATASPSPNPGAAGGFCGGIAGIECVSGYTCQLDGSNPDAADVGGKCIPVLSSPSSSASPSASPLP
ncbi:hypothetical protein KKE78_03405 [Patescibacteria group bacterium]|nr:hypothetical protein [Patescibacteria group bacterium]